MPDNSDPVNLEETTEDALRRTARELVAFRMAVRGAVDLLADALRPVGSKRCGNCVPCRVHYNILVRVEP